MDGSFDDLATPLHEVTFCVVDLETTGASAATCAITEVGAARYRGGDCLGTFQTLVDADAPVDPAVTALTGITDAMLRGCPPIDAVLPALAEFAGGAVLVGHNVRFDVSFLDAALHASDRGAVGARTVDTVALARRLLGDETPDLRLATLAEALALPRRPSHRALDDVLATADLLHALLERAAGLGVVMLDDLLALPHLARHAPAAKLRLTARLPRGPGVYVLRDAQGSVLRVEAAADVRRAVRDLFARDPGRGVRHLLRTVDAVDHVPCDSPAEAATRADEMAATMLPPARRRRRRPAADAGLRCAAC
jgi:DNA polymerase-3 subunit epsilon